MNNNSNLMPFAKDGLELVIDMNSGEAFASISATARMVEKGESTIRYFITSQEFDLKSAEINTQTGLKTSQLLNELQIYEVCEKYNPSLLKAFAQAGLRVYLHKMAEFEVKSTATDRNSSDLGILEEILKIVRDHDRRLNMLEGNPENRAELPPAIVKLIDKRKKTKQAYAALLEIRNKWCESNQISEVMLGDCSFCVAVRSWIFTTRLN